MKLIIIFCNIFFLILVNQVLSSDDNCGPNAQMGVCLGCCGHSTCSTIRLRDWSCLVCQIPCRPTCTCYRGYVLNKDEGECIPVSECP
ncbi:unnamed protein product [Psylliodes chrysocephalus]|uniref:TIL domain-containing protein n=1 Tax=Psylliodes chrysocephalus TaxID=3402493 RepID=A0A9P0D812_9CUCU|nr:unnamed protein product [Psylliodes chrysocephala]